MALLPTGFKERLEQMELCRIQRLSLLQAEKEVQLIKSQALASMITAIKSADHRCLNLQQQIASKHFVISSLKSRIDCLHSEYVDVSQQFRALKSEVQELEELGREKERYFASEIKEMESFKAEVAKFAVESRREVQELNNQVEQLKSSFVKLQGNIGSSDDSELAAAETRKSELLAEKENMECRLASSYQIRAQLQKQLQSILMTQSQAEGNLLIAHKKLKSSFVKLQGNFGSSDDSELAAAEIRKSKLLAEKEQMEFRLDPVIKEEHNYKSNFRVCC